MHQDLQQGTLKVHYFYIRGQCQPIRNLLYHMEIDFQDIMHEKAPKNSIDAAFNIGFPMVEDGDVKVHDSIAIMNYLCRKYNKLDLLGLTPQSFAKIQQVMIRYSMQKKRIIANICDTIKYLALNTQEQREKAIREKMKKLITQCKFVEYCLKKTAINKSFVRNHLTLIDFLYYEICFYLQGFFNNELKRHNLFKNVIQFKNSFQKLPFFQKYSNKLQEKYIFFEFDDIEMNRMIEQYWKGKSRCIKLQANLQ